MTDFNHSASDRQEVHSLKVKAGKRTYFFDVRTTREEDYYLTITESKKRGPDGHYEKHKIFLYKEDFDNFVEVLQEAVQYIKEKSPAFDENGVLNQEEHIANKNARHREESLNSIHNEHNQDLSY